MRRSLSVVTSFVLAAGLIVGLSPGASAVTCSVTNARTGASYVTLSEAVDASMSGDTLGIEGVCEGAGKIRGKLVLKGVPTSEQPVPTLSGGGDYPVGVLQVAGPATRVTIRNITITDGYAYRGGGIDIYRGRVDLRGSTAVTGNRVENLPCCGSGGGIYVFGGGKLVMHDSSSVSDNDALEYGGGVYVYEGTVVLRDSASVTGNHADYGGGIESHDATVVLMESASIVGNAADNGGGGIYNSSGTLTLNDAASVTGNTAFKGGGIYNRSRGRVVLTGSASVTGNTAAGTGDTEASGGGIFIDPDYFGSVYVCSDDVAISPNDPDDPPKVRHVCP